MASGIKCSVYDSQFKGKKGLGEEMAEKEWPPRWVQTQEKPKAAYVYVMGNLLNLWYISISAVCGNIYK